MNWLADHTLHLLLMGVYLAVLARHAWVGRRHVRSVDDYLVAGRRMGGGVIALSFYATFMSTNTFIGAAGKSWEHGVAWCLGGVILTALAALSWLVVAPRFVPLTRQYQSLTVADFVGHHYGSPAARRVAAAIVAFSSVLYLVAIYRGASLALESYLQLPYVWCVLGVFLIVTAYTLCGGFESVVLTDALQGVLMLFGAVALLVGVMQAGGGPGPILSRLRQQDPQLVSFTNTGAIASAAAYSLAVGVKYLVEPRQLSRFYGLRDRRAMRTAAWLAPTIILVTYACLLPLGAMARVVIPLDAVDNTDRIVPYLLGPAGLLGTTLGTVFLLVLVSAAMSSIDSVLLVAASTIDRDLIRYASAAGESGDGGVRQTRRWVVLVSLAAAAAALLPQTQDIVKVTKFSGSLYGACFLPVIVLGLFQSVRRAAAAIATMIAGAVTVIGVFAMRQIEWTTLQEVYPGMLVGIAVFAVLSRGGRAAKQAP